MIPSRALKGVYQINARINWRTEISVLSNRSTSERTTAFGYSPFQP